MAKKVVAGNWKMNLTKTQTVEFINEVKESCNVSDTLVVFFVPSINIETAKALVDGTNIKIGCQNMHQEESGAFTGEISANMIKDIGLEHILVGHSERRQYFNETDEIVNQKINLALKNKLKPMLCVGEVLEERENGTTNAVVSTQVKGALKGIEANELKNIIIAYEPVWAIGTGKTATNEEAQEVCKYVREIVKELYDEKVATDMSILYGGSVNNSNASDLFKMADIDGGLVGGASLKPDFSNIINA